VDLQSSRSSRPQLRPSKSPPFRKVIALSLSSRELVTLFVFEKTDGENKKLRCFQEREKSIKSQTPTGAPQERSGSAVFAE
jgi:hypothetical protein